MKQWTTTMFTEKPVALAGSGKYYSDPILLASFKLDFYLSSSCHRSFRSNLNQICSSNEVDIFLSNKFLMANFRPIKVNKPAVQAAGETLPEATPPIGKVFLFQQNCNNF